MAVWLAAALGCQATSGVDLIEVRGLKPARLQAAAPIQVLGEGFPVGRAAQLELTGELLRPGAPPERVQIRLAGQAVSEHAIAAHFTDAAYRALGGRGTLRGHVTAVFPAAGGNLWVSGTSPPLELDVMDASPARALERDRRGQEHAERLGLALRPDSGGGGLVVEAVKNGSAAAGVLEVGDRLVVANGVRLRAVGDLLPPPNQGRTPLLVAREGMTELLRRHLDHPRLRHAPHRAAQVLHFAVAWLGLLLGLGWPLAKPGRASLPDERRRLRPWTLQPWTLRPWTLRPWTLQPWTLRPWTLRPRTLRRVGAGPAAGLVLAGALGGSLPLWPALPWWTFLLVVLGLSVLSAVARPRPHAQAIAPALAGCGLYALSLFILTAQHGTFDLAATIAHRRLPSDWPAFTSATCLPLLAAWVLSVRVGVPARASAWDELAWAWLGAAATALCFGPVGDGTALRISTSALESMALFVLVRGALSVCPGRRASAAMAMGLLAASLSFLSLSPPAWVDRGLFLGWCVGGVAGGAMVLLRLGLARRFSPRAPAPPPDRPSLPAALAPAGAVLAGPGRARGVRFAERRRLSGDLLSSGPTGWQD